MHVWSGAATPLLLLNDKCTAVGNGNLTNGIFISALELSSSPPDIWGWEERDTAPLVLKTKALFNCKTNWDELKGNNQNDQII